MKSMRIIYLFILSILSIICIAVKGEVTPDKSVQKLQTDKTTFVSGETIWFKNSLVSYNNNEHQRILFVDLCGEGEVITSRILLRNNNHWEGDIYIPDSLETGIYLLRAYTGNYNGKAEITSKLVTVINRFGNNKTNELRKQIPENSPLDQTSILPQALGNKIKLETSGSRFSTKETIKFKISNNLSDSHSGLSLSVYKVPENAMNKPHDNIWEEKIEYASNFKNKIYNDLTLSGIIKDKSNNQPISDEFVLFSTPDTIPQIIYSKTDSKGEFYFHLGNLYGEKDAIIQMMTKDKDYKIEIYPGLLDPPARIPFYIPSEVENNEFIKLTVQRAVLHKIYNQDIAENKTDTISKYPFYGKTSEIIYPDDYFDMSGFEEMAKEILPICKVKKSKDQYSLKVFNPDKIGNFENPWLLVDGIPVFEVKDVLHLGSSKIKKVETIAETRCYGDLYIEGAVSIFTYSKKFKEVALPKNAIRIPVETFYNSAEYKSNRIDKDSNFADFRDVLYWEPIIDEETSGREIEIQSSYEKGKYIAVAESIDSEGEIHRSVYEFDIE